MPNKIELLRKDLENDYNVGSLDEFTQYLSDDKNRKQFFEQVVKPRYDVSSLEEFDAVYGFKKKQQASPSRQRYDITFSESTPRETQPATASSYSAGYKSFLSEPESKTKKKEVLQNVEKGLFESSELGKLKAEDEETRRKRNLDAIFKEQDPSFYQKAYVNEEELANIPKENLSDFFNEKYGALGFTFKKKSSPTGFADLIEVSSDEGDKMEFSVNPVEGVKSIVYAKPLQQFMYDRSKGKERPFTTERFLKLMEGGLNPEEEQAFRRMYDNKIGDYIVKSANNIISEGEKSLSSINDQIKKLSSEANAIAIKSQSAPLTDYEKNRFNEIQQQVKSLSNDFETKKESIKKSIDFTDESIKKATAERLRLSKDEGEYVDHLKNTFVKGGTDMIIGAIDALISAAKNQGQYKTAVFYENIKKYGEQNREAYMSDVSSEYIDDLPFLAKAATGIVQTLPTMLAPTKGLRLVGTTLSLAPSYSEKLESTPGAKDMTEMEKSVFVWTSSLIQSQLEELGFSNAIINKGNLVNTVTANVLKRVLPNQGYNAIKKLATLEINNVAGRYLARTAGSVISEAETGAMQSISDIGIEDIVNEIKGKEIFKNQEWGTKEFFNKIMEDAALEGAGGLIMGGVTNLVSEAGYQSNINNFSRYSKIIGDPTLYKLYQSKINADIVSGKITKEKGEQIKKDAANFVSTLQSIPENLSKKQKYDAFVLVKEKKKLEEEIVGKDKSLVSAQIERIAEIDNRLKEISKNAVQKQSTGEVPVQSETGVGQEVVEGKPETEYQGAPQEGQKEVVAGVEITYPTEQQREERQGVRNSDQYVLTKSLELPRVDVNELIDDLEGDFAMVTGENPKGQPLSEEENQALNEKAKEWLINKGYDPKPLVGKFNQAENSFFVKGMTQEDAIAFAREFNQEAVAHSSGMVYQDGSMNPRTEGDNLSFRNFEPGMDMVSIVNTSDGPKQFSIAYDFDTKVQPNAAPTAAPSLTDNIKSAIKSVFPNLKIVEVENADQMREAVAQNLGEKASQKVSGNDAGRVFFKGGKMDSIYINKSLASDTTLAHEVWHGILAKAFGENEKLFRAFRSEITQALRDNGYNDIADRLDEFSLDQEYIDTETEANEWLSEFGGMLTAAKIDPNNLTSQQKTLLDQIKEIVNKFANQIFGQPVFLEQATPKDILNFMADISKSLSEGEDIGKYFEKPTKLDKNGNLPEPTTKAQKLLKDNNKQIEKNTKSKVETGDNVSTRIPSKGNPHAVDNLIVSTDVIVDAAKTDKNAKDYAIKLAKTLGSYPNVNISEDSINTLEDAQNVFDKFKKNVKNNLKWLYDQFSDEVRTITKLWYDGANIVSNEIAKKYGYTTNQVAGVMAVLSPQMDWFRNLSLGKRVIDIYTTKQESVMDKKMEDYIRNANSGTGKNVTPLFEGPAKKLTDKSVELLIDEMKGKKFKDMSIPEKAFFIRAYDEVYNTRDYENISPTGEINGFVMTDKGARAKVGWGGFGPIMKSVSILENGSIENISENLGNQHKVRNFFVNISNPNDKNAVTIDTHAVAAALLKPLAGSDAEVNTNLSGPPKSASTGLVGSYPVLADAYRELANELGILPRELQSITWEAIRGLYKASFKTAKNKKSINDTWEKYRNGEINEKKLYEEISTKAGGVSKPVWYEYVAEGDIKTNEENSAAINQGKLSDDYGGERSDSEQPEVTTKAQKATLPKEVENVLTDDGKGNYVFKHYSHAKRDVIKPGTGAGSLFMNDEEKQAISSVGGVAMYYTEAGQKEAQVGNEEHTVLVPKDKVYYMNADELNFYDEAKEQFLDYKNRGNKQRINYAFSPNYQGAWIAKVAAEHGYDMIIMKWGGKGYRAQTTKSLKPIDGNVEFKKAKEHYYKKGDKVLIRGQEAVILDRQGDLLTYGIKNQFGGMNTGKHDIGFWQRAEQVRLVEAAPEEGEVTTKAQKVEVENIPGYNRMMSEANDVIAKSIDRGKTVSEAVENAKQYMMKSAVYEKADDLQRNQLVRDFYEMSGKKLKSAPSIDRLFGIKDEKTLVSEKQALKDQLRLEAKAAKGAVNFVKELRQSISLALLSQVKRGNISAAKVATMLKKYDSINILNPVMRDRFIDFMSRAFEKADYMDKLNEANTVRSQIKKAMKNNDTPANMAMIAKDFSRIIPGYLENIDEYLDNAQQIMKAITRKAGPRVAVEQTSMGEYIDSALKNQDEMMKDAFMARYEYLSDAGIINKDMTLNEMKQIVKSVESEGADQSNIEEAQKALEAMYEDMRPYVLDAVKYMTDPITGEPMELSPEQVKLVKQMLTLDFSTLSLPTMYKMVEGANNFLTNGSTDGLATAVKMAYGDSLVSDLNNAGVKSQPLKRLMSKAYHYLWAKYLTPLPTLIKEMFVTRSAATQIKNASGLTEFMLEKAKAVNIANKIIDNYEKKFAKAKDFFSAENIVERGILAFASRTVEGDSIQKQNEFNRRKSIVKQTIDALKSSEDADRVKKGEIYEAAYNKILKDANNIEELKANCSSTNKEAVDFWVNAWKEFYPKMSEVSRSVYNTILNRDENYTPDRFQRLFEDVVSDKNFEIHSGFLQDNDVVDTKKSGSLMENKRVSALPKNQNGQATRIVNLDFDIVNSKAIVSALVDIYTAESVAQMKGFLASKNLRTLFDNKESMDVFKSRLINYVNISKGKGSITPKEIANMKKTLDTLANIGAAKVMAKLTMPLAQTLPTFLYTTVKTGQTGLSEVIPSWQALSDAGLPISNRGIGSRAELKTFSSNIKQAQDGKFGKGLDAIEKANAAILKYTLQHPDAFAARAAWIAYYKQALKRKGVDVSNIDWANHKFNKDAAAYAEEMQTAHQNVNDTDMLGELMTNPNWGVSIARKMVLPFMGFVINSKSRIMADLRTASNSNVSTRERVDAGLGIAATVVEFAMYRAMLFAVAELWQAASNWIVGEEDDEEDRKKRVMKSLANASSNFVNDMIAPPVPGADMVTAEVLNKIFDATGLKESVPQSMGLDAKNQFSVYVPSSDFFDQMGAVGILPSKLTKLAELAKTAATGEVESEFGGKTSIKKLSEEDQQLAQLNAYLYAAYILALPADFDAIITKNDRTLKSRAMTDKQLETYKEVGASDYELMRKNGITSKRQLMLLKGMGEKDFKEYKKSMDEIKKMKGSK